MARRSNTRSTTRRNTGTEVAEYDYRPVATRGATEAVGLARWLVSSAVSLLSIVLAVVTIVGAFGHQVITGVIVTAVWALIAWLAMRTKK